MSAKDKGYDNGSDESFDTSHYLGQLNEIYSKYAQGVTESWDNLDDEVKYELVIKSLFVIKELDDSPVDSIMENLKVVLDRGDELTTPILRFMLDQHLVTEKAGKIHLTGEGREILK